jgi:hypothetical protein
MAAGLENGDIGHGFIKNKEKVTLAAGRSA